MFYANCDKEHADRYYFRYYFIFEENLNYARMRVSFDTLIIVYTERK